MNRLLDLIKDLPESVKAEFQETKLEPGTYLCFTDEDDTETVLFEEKGIRRIWAELIDDEYIIIIEDNNGIFSTPMGGIFVFEIK